MRKCEIDGCTNQHRARGLCIVHYNNWVRYQSGAGKFETKFRTAERERIVGLLEPFGECEPSICGKGCRGEYRCVGWAYRHAIRLIKADN